MIRAPALSVRTRQMSLEHVPHDNRKDMSPYESETQSTIGSPASQNINWLPKNTNNQSEEMETKTIYQNRPAILPKEQRNVLDGVALHLGTGVTQIATCTYCSLGVYLLLRLSPGLA